MNIPCLFIEDVTLENMEHSTIQTQVILMHFGLSWDQVNGIPFQYTVAICKRKDSGQIIYVDPRSLIVEDI